MKQWLVISLSAAVALCAVLAGGFWVLTSPFSDVAAPAATSSLESAALPAATVVQPPAAPDPDPRFSRAVMGPTTMPGSDVMLDLCSGPVAIDLGSTYPLLIAEHDYCGGSGWISRLTDGDVVELTGEGVDPGSYVVSAVDYGQRRVARFSDMPDAAIVLQTCISETKIILVGLEPVSPDRPA